MSLTDDWLRTESPDDWLAADEIDEVDDAPGVYFRNDTDASQMSEYSPHDAVSDAAQVRAEFGDGVLVVITAGPHRPHEVAFQADPETRRVRLDYSVRPGHGRIGEIIADLRDAGFGRSRGDRA